MLQATKRAILSTLRGINDKGAYLIHTLPSLYKCTHMKRKKMIQGIFWLSLVQQEKEQHYFKRLPLNSNITTFPIILSISAYEAFWCDRSTSIVYSVVKRIFGANINGAGLYHTIHWLLLKTLTYLENTLTSQIGMSAIRCGKEEATDKSRNNNIC